MSWSKEFHNHKHDLLYFSHPASLLINLIVIVHKIFFKWQPAYLVFPMIQNATVIPPIPCKPMHNRKREREKKQTKRRRERKTFLQFKCELAKKYSFLLLCWGRKCSSVNKLPVICLPRKCIFLPMWNSKR